MPDWCFIKECKAMNEMLINRYRNVMAGLFSTENAKFTQIRYFNGKYYVNEPTRLDNGSLTNIPTNWKIYTNKTLEDKIQQYEQQLLDRIEK